MRQLASVQRIEALDPIPGADAIQVASVLGWKVVVKRDEFKVGDRVVYCEVDSLLPKRAEFLFLEPRGMRIRTIRLRGQVSQGICFPLSILPSGTADHVGADVSEALGIVKYEAPVPAHLAGKVKGLFPGFLRKTDETRVQVLQEVLDRIAGLNAVITEKLDGSSVTYYLRNGEFGVCSRNLELLEEEGNSLWKLARTLQVEEKLRALGGNHALQGEIVGEGIQKNIYKLRGQAVYFFDLFDSDAHRHMAPDHAFSIFRDMGLHHVPVVEEQWSMIVDVDALVRSATRKSLLNPQAWAEGIVFRCPLPAGEVIVTEKLVYKDRVSFKVINPEFLLAHSD